MDKGRLLADFVLVLFILHAAQSSIDESFEDDDEESPSWSRCPFIRNKLKNGRVKIRSRGRIAKFMCYPGFELAGKRFTTCVRGQWNNPVPVCVSRGCFRPPAIANARVSEMYRGAVLLYECLPGYTISGGATVYCDGKQWSSDAPRCEVATTAPQLSCDFEDPDLCGWSHDPTHDFDWKRNQFSTPSGHVGTGPTSDHTFGPGKGGFYLYMEASSPRKVNDTARLFSPVFPKENSGGCFLFWYHMFGSTTGGLQVYIKPESHVFVELSPTWATFGDQGNQWFRGNVTVPQFNENFQIVIEGIRGSSYIGDTAIDDISLNSEDCSVIGNSTDHITEFISTSCRGRCREVNDSYPCGCNDNCLSTGTSVPCCEDFLTLCTRESEGPENPEEHSVSKTTLLPVKEITTPKQEFTSTTNEQTPLNITMLPVLSTFTSFASTTNSPVPEQITNTAATSTLLHTTSTSRTTAIPIEISTSSNIAAITSTKPTEASTTPNSISTALSTNSASTATSFAPTTTHTKPSTTISTTTIPTTLATSPSVTSKQPSTTLTMPSTPSTTLSSKSTTFSPTSTTLSATSTILFTTSTTVSTTLTTAYTAPTTHSTTSRMPFAKPSTPSTMSTTSSTTSTMPSTTSKRYSPAITMASTSTKRPSTTSVMTSTMSTIPSTTSTMPSTTTKRYSPTITMTSTSTKRPSTTSFMTSTMSTIPFTISARVSTVSSKTTRKSFSTLTVPLTTNFPVITTATPIPSSPRSKTSLNDIVTTKSNFRYTSVLPITVLDTEETRRTYNLRPRISTTSYRSYSLSTTQKPYIIRIRTRKPYSSANITSTTSQRYSSTSEIPSTALTSAVSSSSTTKTVLSTTQRASVTKKVQHASTVESNASNSSQSTVTIVSVLLMTIACIVVGLVFYIRRWKARRQSKLADDSEMRFLNENEINEFSDSSALDRINFNQPLI